MNQQLGCEKFPVKMHPITTNNNIYNLQSLKPPKDPDFGSMVLKKYYIPQCYLCCKA